jgi:hypothetical protein
MGLVTTEIVAVTSGRASGFWFGGSSKSRRRARDVLRDEMRTDEIAAEAFLSRYQVAVHSMIVKQRRKS